MPSHPADADHALAAAIRRLRKERGLTQEELAHAAGVTFGTVSRLELAQGEPGWMTVRKIAQALGLTLSELGTAIDAEDPAAS
ncbi:MAG: helix-turn-helix domain-containing protein [Solirubrobacteraceae bacterium]